jgi:hypothetical protein
VQFTREKVRDADLNFVQKKVDSIRASFRKELRRVRQTKRIVGKAKAIWMKKLKMLMVIHEKQQLRQQQR